MEPIMDAILIVIVSALSAIPLNIAVKLLGGDSSWIKAIFVNILIDIVSIFLQGKMVIGYILVTFILKLFIYKLIFRIGLLRAFFAWILQYIVAVVLIALLLLLGIPFIIALPFIALLH